MLVCFIHFAREAVGALGTRHSLRPLISEDATFLAKLATMRGEIAKLCLHAAGCLKCEEGGYNPIRANQTVVIARSASDEAIQPCFPLWIASLRSQ
jgi:hypothetical protein